MSDEEKSTDKSEPEEIVQFQYEFTSAHVDGVRESIETLARISHEVYLDVLKNFEGDQESEVAKNYALVVASAVIGAPWAFSLRVLAESTDKFEEVSGDAWELAQVIGDDVFRYADFSDEEPEDEEEP